MRLTAFSAHATALLILLATLSGCGGGGADTPAAAPPAPPVAPAAARATVQLVRFASPWGMAALPDGSWLVTQRAAGPRAHGGRLLGSQPISGAPVVSSAGQGGLLDVALDRTSPPMPRST